MMGWKGNEYLTKFASIWEDNQHKMVFDIDFQIENFKIIVDFLKEKKYKLKQKINH